MALREHWSKRAQKEYLDTLNYIHEEFGYQSAIKYAESLNKWKY